MWRRLPLVALGLALALTGAPARAQSGTDSGRESGAETGSEGEQPREQIGVTGSAGEAENSRTKPPPTPGADEVGLDQLLKLPSSMSFNAERRQGATADEWRSRFRASREAIQEAKDTLEKTRAELDDLASGGGGGNWQVAPPGSNQTENTPMSFKLREELRRGRESLDQAERGQRALIVEADLAGVPEDWRHGN